MTYYLFQIIQHKTIRYPAANMPVSQISLHRLKLVRRKVLVLDLDETLIHSHHDGKKMLMLASLFLRNTIKIWCTLSNNQLFVFYHIQGVLRQTVKPGTPPDFILKVTIDRHPVRFFVHKRPHVDFFLDIVSCLYIGHYLTDKLYQRTLGCLKFFICIEA